MVRYLILIITMFTLVISASGQNKPQLKSHEDSLSYIIGRDVGDQLKELGADIQLPQFNAGVEQALKGIKSPIDSAQADSLRKSFASEVREKMQQEQQEQSLKNKHASDSFLAENRNKNGVNVTNSGLQYTVIHEGNGPKPVASDSVQILYKGMLLDSTIIDSTTIENPAVLDLQRTIPGISEGIQLMNVGSTYRFFLPPDLAYGPMGAPPDIPPNATLIFEVTLQEIMGPERKASKTFLK